MEHYARHRRRRRGHRQVDDRYLRIWEGWPAGGASLTSRPSRVLRAIWYFT